MFFIHTALEICYILSDLEIPSGRKFLGENGERELLYNMLMKENVIFSDTVSDLCNYLILYLKVAFPTFSIE